MSILSIDTSMIKDTVIGIYFSPDEKTELMIRNPLSQEEKLLIAVDNALEMMGKTIDDIETIAVGIGPGSFTGVRIGVSTARALAWSGDKNIVGISSLELLARSLSLHTLSERTLVIPFIDARMKKVFSALFEYNPETDDLRRITEDLDIEPELILDMLKDYPGEGLILAGNGLVKYESVFQNIEGRKVTYMPEALISGLKIAEMVLNSENINFLKQGFEEVFPVYLRKSEAEKQLEERLKKS